MFKRFLVGLRVWMAGARLTRSIRKNERAATELDALLREVLKR